MKNRKTSKKSKTLKCRTCKSCGWVYFGVSREYAENEVKKFNRYFKKLSLKDRKDYYGNKPANILPYETCWCGNSYTNFKKSKKNDCPNGVTMSAIIVENA